MGVAEKCDFKVNHAEILILTQPTSLCTTVVTKRICSYLFSRRTLFIYDREYIVPTGKIFIILGLKPILVHEQCGECEGTDPTLNIEIHRKYECIYAPMYR